MIRDRRISLWVMPLLATGMAGVWLGYSQEKEEDSRPKQAVRPSGPFIPDQLTDTLASEPTNISIHTGPIDAFRAGLLEVSGDSVEEGVPLLAINADSSESNPTTFTSGAGGNGYVETFQLAEPRVGESDPRFRLKVNNPPRSRGEEIPPTALAAVSTGPATATGGYRTPANQTEEIVRRIEKLRSTREEGGDDSGAEILVEETDSLSSLTSEPVEERVGGRAAESSPSPDYVKPATDRSRIGSSISARTMAQESGSDGAGEAFASAVPASGDGEQDSVVIAEVGPQTPFSAVATATPPQGSLERKGLLSRIFNRKKIREERAAAMAEAANRSTLEQFPKPKAPVTKASKEEDDAQHMIDLVYDEYVGRVQRITASDLTVKNSNLVAVPSNFDTVWMNRVRKGYWVGEEPLAVRLEEIYARALMNSNRVRVFGYEPLIRETAIQESEGAFDLESFVNGSYGHTDEPTSTLLDTGEIGRFLERRGEADAGLRRRFATGGQVTLSNRFLTLDNNSEFLEPNPQTGSTLVFSVVQPLLKGGGYHYNKARLKVAKIDSGIAASEYIQQLENHLLEVNRSYWGVYFARAAYLLRKSLVEQTEEIVEQLEARSDEATASELLRARSELSRRRTGLNRAQLSIRNAEERLRSLVNDPSFPIGGEGEFVPVTSPILDPPRETVHSAAMEAVDNRAEIASSFGQLRLAAIRKKAGKHEKLPQLDLLAETSMAGLEANRRVGGAYDDMFSQDASWLVGFQFSQPWENNMSKARHERLQYEMLKQADVVRATMDMILLESVSTFRELMASYRDVQGNLQQVLSTREEIEGLKKRLDIDAGNGQTVAYRLQNVLDALERNQLAEEQFLVSVVTYNIAFADLERAKGTFLKYQDVSIERSDSEEYKNLETLRAVPAEIPGSPDSAASGAK